MSKDKFKLQNSQFFFPYHYIPNFEANGVPVPYRYYPKTMEYLCYQQYIQKCVAQYPDKSILEIGCGDGRFCFDLPQNRKSFYVGVDLSERAISFARIFNPGVHFVHGTAIDIKEKFGLVVSIEVIEHIPDQEVPIFIDTIKDKVSCGGFVIFCAPSVNKPLTDKHYRHYTLQSLCGVVLKSAPNFELISGKYIFKNDRVISTWEKLLKNSLFSFDVHKLRAFVWRHCITKCTIADETNGQHVVAIFRSH